jgi:hypothetical protein
VKSLAARIVFVLILALTVALMDGCAPGCDAATSLFRVAGDSMEGSDHAAINAINTEQVCVQHPLG